MSTPSTNPGKQPFIPELSIVMPCYNEEHCLEHTVPPLAATFAKAGIRLEIVMVDNGSTDQTSMIIDRLIDRGFPITKAAVPVNRGQGLGVITGFRQATGRYVGALCADGQVAPESVLAVYRKLKDADVPTLAKGRRRFRQDNWIRKIVSITYNGLMLVLFPGMPSLDVNGNPKIMPGEILRLMDLTSEDWFLEAEIMLKAWRLGLNVVEMDVPGFARQGGKSKVHWDAVPEFIRNIMLYRFGGPWRSWCKNVDRQAVLRAHAALSAPTVESGT
jgi:glycosyltransferase involved in cell wall biosynthesis